MKDVAERAGVGIKTVSRVINDEPNVTPDKVQRVWDAVRELDYQLDLQARSLRRTDGSTRTLGLLVGSVDNPFAGSIHRSIEDAAAAKGVAVFAASTDDDAEREATVVKRFLQRRVDGLIVTPSTANPDYLPILAERGIPAVYVDREPEVPGLDSVSSENTEGVARGVSHLIAHGHRRIALLADDLSLPTAKQRYEGFRNAYAAAGMTAQERDLAFGIRDSSHAAGVLGSMLDSDDPPTAIFGAQNLITIGALYELRRRGLSHDVALVGFDDFPLADLVEPGVTVVAQDAHAIGTHAAELIFAKLDNADRATQRVRVPTRLLIRGSGELPPRG